MRVLIVFGGLFEAGVKALLDAGIAVETAKTGDEALLAVDVEPPDLCVIRGCDRRARELLRGIRRSSRGAVIPILVVTSDEATTDEQACLDAGADGLVPSSAGEDAVRVRIETMLGLSGGLGAAVAQESDTHEKAVEGEGTPGADPLSTALAAARTLALEHGVSPVSSTPRADWRDMDLRDVIAQAERRVAPLFEIGDPVEPEAPEGLDEVEVEAYFEESSKVAEGLPVETGEPPIARGTAVRFEEEALEGTGPFGSSEDVPTIDARPADEIGTREEDEPSVAGTLEQTRVWDIIAGLNARRESGVVSLVSRGIERRFHMEEGEITMATSAAREDRLIELLYREGRLTESQYQQAAMTIGASGRRAGAVLVEKGLIASRELFPLVRHHYEALIYDTFGWVEGRWRFFAGRQRAQERILLDVPTAGIIMEGMRSRARIEDVDRLAPPGSRPNRAQEGVCPLTDTGLSPHELEILEWCDGKRDTEAIAVRFELTQGELCAILAGLRVLGWVSIEGEGVGEHGSPVRNVTEDRAAARRDVKVERARVADKMAQVEEGTYFAIMEVPWDASGYEIRKAYRRLRGLFAPERFAVDDLRDLRAQADVIGKVLDEAYEILRDSALRESYKAAHGEGG